MVQRSTPPRAVSGVSTQHAKATSKLVLLCLGAAALTPMGAGAQPFFGAPTTIPGTIEAERFDRGGEGPGYHEWSIANTGGAFRPYEAVDIRSDPRQPNSNFVITDFEGGEWLAYTINVTTAGNYDWGISASTPYSGGSYYLQVDGQNMTGPVAMPNTGGWDNFQWVAAPTVYLTQGQHLLRVANNGTYFDLDLIVIFASQASAARTVQQSVATSGGTASPDFACTFNSLPACNFIEQSRVPGRAWLTNVSRDGGTALELHTEPGDNNVVYSGGMSRDDVYLSVPGTAAAEVYGEGVEQYWAHSILFPDDFVVPTTQAYTIFDFHNTGGAWQANFNLAFQPQYDTTQPALLSFIGYGGSNPYSGDGRYGAIIGTIQKNVWYDFVYHVRWSSGSDGFFYGWVNGKQVLAYRGATLYSGQSVYVKLANYHMPVCNWYPGCVGDQASSIIHDRIVRGSSLQAVVIAPVEGS